MINYQLAWITYKRIPVFQNISIQKAFRSKLIEIAKKQNYLVKKLNVTNNTVSLIICALPNVPISIIVKKLKGGTASWMLKNYSAQLSQMGLVKHLWKERHYFVSTVGKEDSVYLDDYLNNIR